MKDVDTASLRWKRATSFRVKHGYVECRLRSMAAFASGKSLRVAQSSHWIMHVVSASELATLSLLWRAHTALL